MGDPKKVKILGFHEGSDHAIYVFIARGSFAQIISAPIVDNLLHASSHEAKNDRNENISHLLLRAATKDKVLSTGRVRKAFEFDLVGIHRLALLRLYGFLFL